MFANFLTFALLLCLFLGNILADEYVGGNEPPISGSSSG